MTAPARPAARALAPALDPPGEPRRPRRTLARRLGRQMARGLLLAGFGLSVSAAAGGEGSPAAPPVAPSPQAAEYRAEAPNSIVELQPFRTSETVPLEPSAGPSAGGPGSATLINLNPAANAWFLLTLDRAGKRTSYHLENPDPKARRIGLARTGAAGLVIADPAGQHVCAAWAGTPSPLDAARASPLAYAPVCDGLLTLRNPIGGHRTRLEQVTEFLRDEVWGGEAIVGFVRDAFFHDAFVEKGTPAPGAARSGPQRADAPAPAVLAPAAAGSAVQPGTLGIRVDAAPSGGLALGRWYPASDLPGVHVSVIRPDAIAPSILERHRQTVNRLDPVEGAALDYLIAFDLADFALGFELGTEHPRLGWSPRPPAQMRTPALPGPDGIGSAAPLVTTGMVSPALAPQVVATFTGGFKREHGAFRYGPLSLTNHGSHYGFIEQGVVFSKLQPGLATLYVLDDGSVDMKTWTAADEPMLGHVRHARQNGVALIESDPAAGLPGPGAFVNKWGPGNWSGSADESLRTLRAGACLQDSGHRRFLIYAYFSTATPSAMARVFQAYGCSYAMQLDINALEHTYLALYVHRGDTLVIEHLVEGMEVLDKTVDGRLVPRFVGFPDNRDFFYLTRQRAPQ